MQRDIKHIKRLFALRRKIIANTISDDFGHNIIFIDDGFKIVHSDLHITVTKYNTVTISNEQFTFTCHIPLYQNAKCTLSENGCIIDISQNKQKLNNCKLTFINDHNIITLYYNNQELINVNNNVIRLLNNIDASDSSKLIVHHDANFFGINKFCAVFKYIDANTVSVNWFTCLFCRYEILYDITTQTVLHETFSYKFELNYDTFVNIKQIADTLILNYTKYITHFKADLNNIIENLTINDHIDECNISATLASRKDFEINKIEEWYQIQCKKATIKENPKYQKSKIFVYQKKLQCFVNENEQVKNLQELALNICNKPILIS